MNKEKRRYFRINETVGLTYRRLERQREHTQPAADIWALISDQDESIERLLQEVGQQSPQVADLIRAMNQKLERVVGQLVMERKLVDSLANRAREVNISACGAGFVCDEQVTPGEQLQIELQLLPSDTLVHTKGRVVGCESTTSGFYWRVDFYEITPAAQEQLIQHVVQRQSAQLKVRRDLRPN